MPGPAEQSVLDRATDEVLGYLNFSSGADDPQFLVNLNQLFRAQDAHGEESQLLPSIERRLTDRLKVLAGSAPAFGNVEQARAVIDLTFQQVIPAYREHHRDLLFHQTDARLWRPFLLGRALQCVLELAAPWDELDRLVDGTLGKLNDFIGYRPVPTLSNDQRMEPYDHEWVAPVPLYIRAAGVSSGRYERLIAETLAILDATPRAILHAAQFDPALLDEFCMDPRAYDFDHPVNKRANYHFGQWDPHHIDGQGRYRRFVAQQLTLDGMLERVENGQPSEREELLFDAAAVLAGTVLMAAGTSGAGPAAYDSSVTLGNLLPRIACYRDEFYKQLLERSSGKRRERLQAEAEKHRQPFAGARQHLNHFLARRRASQLERVHLAILFARMGYPGAARRQAAIVPVASARIISEIRCRLGTAGLAIERGSLDLATELVDEIGDLLHRAIECGAMVDPWTMLGFQGQFSLFPAPENSVPDHRLPELIDLVGDIFALQARLWSEAAARDETDLQDRISRSLAERARWWDQFASTTVDDLESFRAADAYVSALQVADAMKAWHQGGTAAGDIGFWRNHVQQFTSPRAYGLVVDALLAKRDFVASLALLMQWLSQADTISLEQGEFSFHRLSRRWLAALSRGEAVLGTGRLPQSLANEQHLDDAGSPAVAPAGSPAPRLAPDRDKLLRRFFESLEANADVVWAVPDLSLDTTFVKQTLDEAPASGEEDDADDADDNLFAAAYDEVVYRDSTGDGIDADMLESGSPPATDYELDAESRRLAGRLDFLTTVAVLWRSAVSATFEQSELGGSSAQFAERWLPQAEENVARLLELLAAVHGRRIPPPTASRNSLLEFDRRRSVKLALVEQIVATTVETASATRLMRAALESPSTDHATGLLQAVLRGDDAAAKAQWPEFLREIRTQAVLYVSPAKGGDPRKVIEAQRVQHTIREFLRLLPRLGMLSETCQLIQMARLMESEHPVGPNAVTEFDRLFEVGYKSLVETLVEVSRQWPTPPVDPPESRDSDLVDSLEQLTESLLHEWLGHSRTLRLTVLERMLDEKAWTAMSEFIQRYGHDLFTQHFLNLGNLRAILHGGVDAWFERLLEDPEQEDSFLLLRELDQEIPRVEAVKRLTLVLEAIAENYNEYRDYNNTTTQSDRGELLYTLLDFLRVRAQYERVAWQLKPVLLAHEILVRRGRSEGAEMWRRAVADRTGSVADSLEKRLAELPGKYGMRLPTIVDRVGERFVRPLTIDRVRALVRPAMETMRRAALAGNATPDDESYFSVFEQECNELTQEPSGVGLEVPGWLQALETEVETSWQAIRHPELAAESIPPLQQRPLTAEEVTRQLSDWQIVE